MLILILEKIFFVCCCFGFFLLFLTYYQRARIKKFPLVSKKEFQKELQDNQIEKIFWTKDEEDPFGRQIKLFYVTKNGDKKQTTNLDEYFLEEQVAPKIVNKNWLPSQKYGKGSSFCFLIGFSCFFVWSLQKPEVNYQIFALVTLAFAFWVWNTLDHRDYL